jgi:hypothetical protein
MTASSWSTVPGQRQATAVTPDSIRTETNQVNNQYQLLEDEVLASESENESTSIDDSEPGLGGDSSSIGEDTDVDKPSALEEIQRKLAAAWIPSGIIKLARLQVARLIDTWVVQLLQPPPQRQRIIVNPCFENPKAEVFVGNNNPGKFFKLMEHDVYRIPSQLYHLLLKPSMILALLVQCLVHSWNLLQ